MKSKLIGIGLFIMLGTAGSADLNTISLMQMFVQLTIGIILVAAGLLCKGKEEKYDKV